MLKTRAAIHANVAKAGLTRINVAVARAEIAMYPAVGVGLPPARFVKLLVFARGALQDGKVVHGAISNISII